MSKNLKIEELRELIRKGESTDPIVFLESVMNGQDPRRLSSFYELVMEIDCLTNGNLSKSDWEEIVDHVSTRLKYHPVTLKESQDAAKTLSEYLHPKRKSLEVSGIDLKESTSISELTEDEIELFRDRFNNEF